MPTSIELALSTLLPTYSLLPPEVIDLSTSLLAQSRSKATTLKPEEEIARTYTCCHLACQRLGHKLGLDIAKPAPPVNPRTYNKLHGYFNSVLATPKKTPRKENSKDGATPTSRMKDEDTKTTDLKKNVATPPSTGKRARADNEVEVPRFVMPMIRHICKAFNAPEAAPHVFAGVRSMLQAQSEHETPSKKRKTSTRSSGGSHLSDENLPALIATIFLAVSERMILLDTTSPAEVDKVTLSIEGYCGDTTQRLPFLLHVDNWHDELERMNEKYLVDMESMEWYLNIPRPDLQDEKNEEDDNEVLTPAKQPFKTPLRRNEKHAKRGGAEEEDLGAAGLLPGLGTMFQPAVDWLSDERKAEYARWKKGIMKEIVLIEQNV